MRDNNLDQLLPLTNYNPKSKSTTHLLVIMKIQKLNFLFSPKISLLLFNQYHIYFSSPRPFAPLKSPHQSPHKVVIHTTHKEYPLSGRDHTPSLKPAHRDPFVITCKTTKQTKNKNKPENNFFGTLETPHCHQFNHRAKLGFATFIHRKHLTLFLGYTSSIIWLLNSTINVWLLPLQHDGVQ